MDVDVERFETALARAGGRAIREPPGSDMMYGCFEYPHDDYPLELLKLFIACQFRGARNIRRPCQYFHEIFLCEAEVGGRPIGVALVAGYHARRRRWNMDVVVLSDPEDDQVYDARVANSVAGMLNLIAGTSEPMPVGYPYRQRALFNTLDSCVGLYYHLPGFHRKQTFSLPMESIAVAVHSFLLDLIGMSRNVLAVEGMFEKSTVIYDSREFRCMVSTQSGPVYLSIIFRYNREGGWGFEWKGVDQHYYDLYANNRFQKRMRRASTRPSSPAEQDGLHQLVGALERLDVVLGGLAGKPPRAFIKPPPAPPPPGRTWTSGARL